MTGATEMRCRCPECRAARSRAWLQARLWTLRRRKGMTRAGLVRAASFWRRSGYYTDEHAAAMRFCDLAGLTLTDLDVAARVVADGHLLASNRRWLRPMTARKPPESAQDARERPPGHLRRHGRAADD
jgi:hypothetical protein